MNIVGINMLVSIHLFSLMILWVCLCFICSTQRVTIFLSGLFAFYTINKEFRLVLHLIYNIIKTVIYGPSNGNIILHKAITNVYQSNFYVKHNFNKIPDTPCIFAINHPMDLITLSSTILIPKPLVFISNVHSSFATMLTNRLFESTIYVSKHKSSYSYIKEKTSYYLAQQKYIMAYITSGKITRNGYILGRIRTGMLRIAQELSVPIVPIVFDFVKYNSSVYNITVGPVLDVTNINESKKYLKKFFTKNLVKFNK